MTFLSRAEIHRTITTFNIQNSSITTKEPLRFSTKMLNQQCHPGREKFRLYLASLWALDLQHTHTCSLKHFCSLEWPTRYDLDPLLCGSHKCLCISQDELQQGRSPQTPQCHKRTKHYDLFMPQVRGAPVTVMARGPGRWRPGRSHPL